MPINLVRTNTAVTAIQFKRSIGYLSDGTVIVAFFDNGNNNIYIYRSTDRVTWTLVHNFDIGVNWVVGASMVIDGSDNIHLTYATIITASQSMVYYRKYTKGAGLTWTVGTLENALAGANSYSGQLISNVDLDVSDAGWVVIVFNEENTNISYMRLRMVWRGPAGWTEANEHIISTKVDTSSAANSTYGFCSVMRDPRGATGGGHTFLAVGSVESGGGGARCYYFRLADADATISNQLLFEYTSTGILQNDVGTLLPCSGDGGGNDNYWTWVLPYTTGSGGQLRLRWFRLDQDGTLSSRESLELAPVSWGMVGGGGGSSFSFDTFSQNIASVVVNKSEDGTWVGDWVNAGRVHQFRRGHDIGALRYRTSTIFGADAGWSPEGSFPLRLNQAHYSLGGANGAQRNIPNTEVDILLTYRDGQRGVYFGTNVPPEAPDVAAVPIEPLQGSTIVTDVPTLKMKLGRGELNDMILGPEWQIADDAGFTSNVKIIKASPLEFIDARYESDRTVTKTVPASNELNQGLKYIRGRTLDSFQVKSAWTPSTTFTISHPPSTLNHSPTGSTVSIYGDGSVLLDWSFSDTSPTDTQTAYEVEISRVDNGTVVYTSGKVTSNATQHAIGIGVGYKNTSLRWRVRVYDTDDVASVWSGYHNFELADPPVVVITSPVDASTVDNPQPTITWTFTPSNSRPQQTYRVTIRNTLGALIHQTAWLTGENTSYTPPTPVLANSTGYTVQVEGRDMALLVGSDTNAFETFWIPPDAPSFHVDANVFDDEGYVLVTWNDDAHDDDFLSYRVYRTDIETEESEIIYELENAIPSMIYKDWLAKSTHSYRYEVVQVADRFGSEIESQGAPIPVRAESSYYWLIHPDSPDQDDLNIRLYHVIDDSFKEEYEQETMHLIGRGRKTDIGDRLGFSGSLTCEVWDSTDATARATRLKLEQLKASKRALYLRNPFGDLWLVTPGSISVDRVGGVGLRENHTATIDYQEVTA